MGSNPIENESGEVNSDGQDALEAEALAAGEVHEEGVAGRFTFNSLVGWGISLGLHCLVVAILMVVTWSGRPGEGGFGEGKEVGIVLDDRGLNMDNGQAELTMESTSGGSLTTTAMVDNVVDSAKMMELQGSSKRDATGLDALIGIESVTAGESGEMTDKWNSALSGGGGAGGGTTSFFGLTARGTQFVYVVDYSGSMRGAKIQAAKAELLRSIKSLKTNMKFFIIFYNQGFIAMPAENLVAATQENKSRYFDWIEKIVAGGGTHPTEGMIKALSLKPDAIWMLSDGQFGPQACEAIRQANQGAKVQIHTIAFYDNTGEVQLKKIAEENRGAYRFVPGRAIERRGGRRR
ncbi:MAG: VWA domain-containing protein [Phycisphaerae bacterium]|nr:VWA domain-containing protein [Phycisphaerae bacterium]